jgi:hypothetical protein
MLGWPNHPIGGGRPPRLAWGGSATPKSTGLGAAEPPLVAQGVVRPSLGPNAQKQNFERLAQRAAKPHLGPLGVVWPPPDQPVWGGRTTPNGLGGGSATPKPKGRPNHPVGHWGWFGLP